MWTPGHLLLHAALLVSPGAPEGDLFGHAIVSLGDLDGDGTCDFAVSAPRDGTIRVFSGTGETLNTLRGPEAVPIFGWRLGRVVKPSRAGTELVVQASGGMSRPGSMWILDPLAPSTEDAVVLDPSLDLDGPFACLGDANGDGVDDLAVLSTDPEQVDLWVFCGASGARIHAHRLHAGPWKDASQGSLAAVGDHDGDGVPELLVGLDGLSRPRLELISPRRGTRLAQRHPAWRAQRRYGIQVAVVGDVDGDGLPDVGVVEPKETDRWPSWTRSGRVTILSNDLDRLYGIEAPRPTRWSKNESAVPAWREFGRWMGPISDLDGDRRPDIAILDPSAFGGLSIHSGRDGSLLRHWGDAFDDSIGFGQAAAVLGDVDRDGFQDVAVSRVSWHTPSVPGRVHVQSAGSGAELYALGLAGRIAPSAAAGSAPGSDAEPGAQDDDG